MLWAGKEDRGASSTREAGGHLPRALALSWPAWPEPGGRPEEERTSAGVSGQSSSNPRVEGQGPPSGEGRGESLGRVGGWEANGHAAAAMTLTTP